MIGRVLAIGAIGFMVASVVALAGIALWPRGGQKVVIGAVYPSADAETADYFIAQAGQWRVAGRVIGEKDGLFELELTIADQMGKSAPPDLDVTVSMSMIGHAMNPVPAKVRRGGEGVFVAAADLAMLGTWRARINLPDGAFQVPVRVGQ